jgi:hypothetical protein
VKTDGWDELNGYSVGLETNLKMKLLPGIRMSTAQQILAPFTSQTKFLTSRHFSTGKITPDHVTTVAPHQPTDHIQNAVTCYTGSSKKNAGIIKNYHSKTV